MAVVGVRQGSQFAPLQASPALGSVVQSGHIGLPAPGVWVKLVPSDGKLEIRFRGKSIADVLDMTVEEAGAFFKAVPAIRDKMATLQRCRHSLGASWKS